MISRGLVYLSGPISGCSYEGCTTWREDVAKQLDELGIRSLSPMRAKEYLRKKKTLSKTGNYKHPISTSKGITTRDRWDCTRCDVVLVNLLGTKEISIGTVMEIAWADGVRVPIILVMEDKNPHDHLILSQVAGFRVDNLEDGLDIVKALLL